MHTNVINWRGSHLIGCLSPLLALIDKYLDESTHTHVSIENSVPDDSIYFNVSLITRCALAIQLPLSFRFAPWTRFNNTSTRASSLSKTRFVWWRNAPNPIVKVRTLLMNPLRHSLRTIVCFGRVSKDRDGHGEWFRHHGLHRILRQTDPYPHQ